MNVEKNAIAERFSRLPKEKQKVFLELLRKQGIDFARLPIVPAAVDARRALSYAQLRQWFIWQLDPQSTAYHISGALKLDGTLDLPALRASFDALVARHESLRTVFRSDEDGLAEQVILAHTAFDIAVIDLSGDAATQERLSEEARHLKATPFDLTQGPLLRVGVIRVSDREHVLVVVMHHIVSDGWSMQILVDEFMAQYAARVQGRTLVPNPLAIQYADYAAWQRNWLEAGEKERQLAYWIAQLSSDAPVLQLKADHARRADASYRMARHDMVLPPALAQALNTRAKDQSATLFMVLLAGFQALLHRCTGLQDIRVGVPIANRHREETEKIIGFFVNTQVLRNEIDGQTSLAQVLARSRDAAIGAQAHQDLPFEQLVDALRPDRTLSVSPLFQVMFNYQRAGEQAPLTLPGLQLEAYVLQEQAAQFELTLDIGEGADGRVEASFGYAAELFEPQTVARMAGHYLAMLDALAERPQQTVADVDLLSSEERLWLSNCGDNREAHGDAQPVHRQIEAHAKRQPNATALLFGDEVLSYDELNRRANRLAHRLIALGVKPESLVGIAVERSVEMMVGILAILKAGGAYVPLDPEYPGERLSYMVADSGIELLLTQSHLRTLIPGTQAQQSLQVLELDTLDTRSEPDHDPEVALHGESLAYVIYTSGSTGKPKGAAIRHDALYSCMAWMQQAYRLTEADTVLHKAPFGFDVSCWEMFWPLTSGVRLVIANPGDHRDPERLVQLIQRHQITTLNFVPSMLQAFLAHEGIEASTRLKHIIVGGEAMPAQTQREALRRLHGATLQNLYGPTETTIHVTRWTCRDDGQSQVPIGRPISQTQALVLDGSLNPVPQGVAGELYLGGISLARGYLKRAGLTAERFVATEGGQRLYRTGDLVRWNNEGQLEYLGRIDHQVKVRGFRIELGEIEAQLLAQESVREAVVVANQGPAGARLVGYVSGQDIDTAVLRARLAEALPDYMVPGALVVLDALPLNANGKVDRKALPDAQFGGAQEYEAPQGEVEEALSQIWSQVLGVQRVGRNDNFFELGGHSLLALKLLERMRAQGWSVQVRTLFQQPALAAFAQAVVQSQGRREVVVPVNGIPQGCQAIEPSMLTLVELDAAQIGRIEAAIHGGAANIQDIYPLAPLQEGILFHHLLEAGADAYITRHLLSFDSRQRLERFVDSFNQVIARHDILRTAVLWEGLKEPVQVVQRHAELKLQWLDDEADGTTTDTVQRLDAHVGAAHYRIDVRQAPMIRAVAAHDAVQGRWLLQVPSHHMVLDHTTLELIIEEIALIQQGGHHELPEPIPFRRFVAQARLGVSQAEHEAFFGKMLGDVDEPTAPFNLLDVQGDGRRVAEARLTLEAGLSSRVRQQAQRHGVSAATLFHLAWALVLARTTGQDDVVFGTVLFGRMQGGEGADRALGLFINTLPVRIRLGRQSVAQCVKQAHAALTDLLHHEHASLSLAQRCSGLPGGTPLFSSLLNYRYSAAQASRTWEGMEPLKGEERTSYPVTMSIDDMGESFRLVAQIMDDVNAQRICDCMHRVVEGLVEALATKSDQLASGLQVLTEGEIHQLDRWGERTLHSQDATPVHHLIERQAQQRPQAVALQFGDEVLSYGDLNRRANRLAHRLIALGVKPETLVGIALERSIDMVVGLLAVLKAGGAYVPLDPQYPADRLAYMVEDGGIQLLLTQSHIGAQVSHGDTLTVLALDTLDLGAEPETNPTLEVHGDNLAYVIYTSGSTGKPKGAQLCHRNVARLLDATRGWFEFGPQDVWTMFHSYAFDFSVWEIFGALCTGGKLVIVPFWVSRSPEDFLALLRDQRVTVLNQTPSAFGQLIHLPDVHDQDLALRVVIFGGEALEPERLRPWIERRGDARPQLINMYGITETTVHVTYRRITAADLAQQRSPMGIGIPDLGLRVLDSALEATPIGVAGELFVSGAGLSRGYLKRATLTAERFIATEGGQRLYRTGDLVRWNGEGQLEYLGRIDHQVKVRGFRIELGEIEAQLLAQPEVREAIVIANEGPAGTRLVAYVSPQAAHAIDIAMLKDALGRVLPDYMVPAAVVVLGALPLNANGKVDRKALPDAEFGSAQEYEAPQGEVEEALSQIWSQVLGVQRVGRNDNFFELGGHSLMCVQMIARVQAAMHTTLTIKDVFQHPTVAGMAGLLASAGSAKPAPEALSEIDAFLDSLEETA
jgi:amino acid adenylation domain-containing protein